MLRKTSLLLLLVPVLSGCQIGYLIENGYYQAKLLTKRTKIEKVLQQKELPKETRSQLELIREAKAFAESELKLKPTKNYQSFVQLETDYVSYLLTAAPAYELEPYKWTFPIVGSFPYKGYFNKKRAFEAEQEFIDKGYDTYVRGVSAYSTLGWFNDPILSSMIRYQNYDLVNLIIHETVHATIFIKDAAEFNERLATFIGDLGTELFFLKKEGENSPTLRQVKDFSEDEKIFSTFISEEINALEKWYETNKETLSEGIKKGRLREIQLRFAKNILPKMKSNHFAGFAKKELNNAKLIQYRTYLKDLSDFKAVYEKYGSDFARFLEYCRSLENSKNPENQLHKDAFL